MKKTKTRTAKRSVTNTSGIRPLADRVLIKEIDDRESTTASGIYIPETVDGDKGSKKGTVIAVGDGHYDDGELIKVRVAVGDTVLFQWGDKLKVGGVEYFIVRENEILAVVEADK